MSTPIKINNDQARSLAIYFAGLSDTPTGPCNQDNLLSIINALGYVQLDPLSVIARAHDHILWSRNNQYRQPMLDQLLQEHHVFEHFCHDACVLPMQSLPYWKPQFRRQAERLTSAQWRADLKPKDKQCLIKRIKTEGALRSIDLKNEIPDSNKSSKNQVWAKPEHKKILDYLWLKGDLAISKRHNFTKYYDLAERVFPKQVEKISHKKHIDWLQENALSRLGFATPSEIMHFWEACSLTETKTWCDMNKHKIDNVQVESSNGEYRESSAYSYQRALLSNPPKPTQRIRIINPFDPLVRDRKRLKRLFGFDYKIEIYIPAKKRQYGYYVYPILEFNRFVGRIEIKHDRKSNVLLVDNLWPEAGIKFGKERMKKLNSEIERVRIFCNAKETIMAL